MDRLNTCMIKKKKKKKKKKKILIGVTAIETTLWSIE